MLNALHPRVLRAALVTTLATATLAACIPATPVADPSGSAVETTITHPAVSFDGAHVASDTFAMAADSGGVAIIDVRTPAEFAEGHLPGAVNIDVSAPGFADAVAELDPGASYAVYCRSGSRSRAAIEQMSASGLDSTVGLEGGIGAWTGALVVD